MTALPSEPPHEPQRHHVGPDDRKGARRKQCFSTLLVSVAFLLPLGVYVAAMSLIAAADHTSFSAAAAFDPERIPNAPILRQALVVLAVFGAVGGLFISPGLLSYLAAMRMRGARSVSAIWPLLINSLALFVLCLVLRNSTGILRATFCCCWGMWTLILFFSAWQPGGSPAVLMDFVRQWRGAVLIGASTMIAAIVAFFPEQAIQCFNEDGTEAFELARSLRHHELPAWELENWESGGESRIGTVVVNPSLVNSYWTMATLILLGDNEFATRLPYWVWWFGILLLGCRLAGNIGSGPGWFVPVAISLLMFLNVLLFSFYVGYNSYMADLANPGVPDALFTICILGSIDALRHGDRSGTVVSILLASLVLYAGPVFLALTIVGGLVFRPLPIRSLIQMAACSCVLLGLIVAAYVAKGSAEGVLNDWVAALDVEYVNDYLAAVPRWKSGALFSGYFVLGAGGLPAWGLIRGFRGEPWQRTLAAVTLMYLLVVLGSGYKNLHYLAPLWPLATVLFLAHRSARRDPARRLPSSLQQRSAGLRGRRWRCVVAACSTTACIALAWPVQRSTFTLNRQLGGLTTFATDSYLEAVQWGRIRLTLRRFDAMSWDCDQHTWAAYAKLESNPHQPRPILLSKEEPANASYLPVAFRRVEGTDVVAMLYVRDDRWLVWLATQQPPGPTERYAPVFLPLAEGPYSPHDNLLEDVRRFDSGMMEPERP